MNRLGDAARQPQAADHAQGQHRQRADDEFHPAALCIDVSGRERVRQNEEAVMLAVGTEGHRDEKDVAAGGGADAAAGGGEQLWRFGQRAGRVLRIVIGG